MNRDARTPFFIGRFVYWLIAAVVNALLAWMGDAALHVRRFPVFISVLMIIAFAVVLVLPRVYRRGERVTREPLPQDGCPGSGDGQA
jgi:hypothetical protein